MADIPRIQIIAEVDERASASRIESQLPSISSKIKERVRVGLEIDEKNIASDVSKISTQVKSAVKRGTGRVTIPVEIGVEADNLKRLLEVQINTLQERIKRAGGKLDFSKFYQAFNRGTLEGFKQAQKELRILEAQYTNFDAKIAKILPRDAIENLNKYIKGTNVSLEELITKFQGLRVGVV